MKIRILSLLLALCMLCTMAPVPARAAEGTDSGSLTWSLDATGTLTISGTGPMEELPWQECRDRIRKVVLSDGITTIADDAFYACSNLQTISIPASVTMIGSSAFAWSALDNIVFEGNAPVIAENAFSGVDAVAFYPAGDESWTDEVLTGYEGALTWTDLSIASIQVEDVTIMQYTGGYESGIYDETTGEETGTYYHYDYDPDFTVTMSSGAVYQGEAGWIDIEFISFDLIYGDDQGPGSPWEPGEHTVTATLGQACADFTVTIQENPVERIQVEPLTLYAGADGWMDSRWDEEQWEWVENAWFHYDIAPRTITIHYKDGTTLTGSEYEIADLTGHYPSYIDPQDYSAQWGVGVYTATAEFMGVTCDYQITILENPVEWIQVEPLTLYAGVDGWMDGYWDEDQGDRVENTWFRYDVTPRTVTIHYTDGTSLTGNRYEIEDLTGYYVGYSDPQDHTAPWGVGDYTATAEYMGVTCDYQVTILENPVERFEVAPLTLEEGVDGSMNGYWDEETDDWVDNAWFSYDIYPRTVTVYYKDGTTLTGNRYEIENMTGYSVSYSDSQDHTAPWGPGTYTATATYMGLTCQYRITIVENAVERIGVEPITFLEGTGGYWKSGWDEAQQDWIPDAWYYYDISPERLTIYYKDGTTFTGYMYEIQEQTGAYPSSSSDQSESAPWGPGVHTAMVHCMGRTCEYQVTIQPNNVERIEVAPITLLEGVDGQWASHWEDGRKMPWFQYELEPRQITVYYRDGTSRTGTVQQMESLEGGYVSSRNEQDVDNQWGVGTYTARAQFMGRTCQYQVTIVENDVESIEIAPVTLYEGLSGQQQDDWFEYQISPRTITLRYKDGTSETCSVSEIAARMGIGVAVTDEQSYYAPWGVGSYTATAWFMGRSCEFQVNILENPIASISLVQMPEKTVFRTAERIDLKSAVLRVTFTDGTWEDVQIDRSTGLISSYYHLYQIEKLDCSGRILLSERALYDPGTHTISLEFAGKSCDFTVEVRESTITGITLRSPDGRKLQIAATQADGTTALFDVLWLEDGLGDGTEEYVMVGGNFITDQGTFYGYFYQLNDGGLYLDASMGPGGQRLRSNTLYGCGWLGNWERVQDYIGLLSCMNSSGDSFTGVPHAQNINKLVEVLRNFESSYKSFYNADFELNPTLEDTAFIYTGAEIRSGLEALFAIENADLSLSDNYDPATDTYAAYGQGWGSGPFELSPEFLEEDGLLHVTVTLEDGTRLRMMLDDANRITAYYLFEADHDHDYENGRCTACGEKEKPVYTVTYTSVSISLAGDIGVNYYVQLSPNVVNDPGAYMQFSVADRTLTVPLRDAEISSIDPGGLATYRFTCKVAAKQMTDAITGQMYLSDGTPVGAPKIYSVKAYCDAAIPTYGQYAAYAELVDLMEAMLLYGGRSQVQFGYNMEDLADNGLDLALPALTAADLAPYAHGAEGAESGIVVSNVSLLLESTTTIRFYFRLDGTRSIDEYTFYVDGVKTVPVRSGDNQYYVDKVNVAAKDLDRMVTVTVGGLTVNYCGMSYVRQVAVLYPNYYSAALVNVAKALYTYNQAANAYFE